MKFYVKNWAAIAPGVWGQEGLESLAQTQAHSPAEIPFQLDFLKPAQRRRLTLTTKLALQAATLVAPQDQLSRLPTVFVTRHGELANTVKVLAELEKDEIPSPTQFIHSVHGTAAGTFSILLENVQASITLANGPEELAPTLFEIASILHLGEAEELLVVFFDAPPVGQYADYVHEPQFPYAAAFHFHKDRGELALELVDSGPAATAGPGPQSLSFASWLQSGARAFPLLPQGGWQVLKAT